MMISRPNLRTWINNNIRKNNHLFVHANVDIIWNVLCILIFRGEETWGVVDENSRNGPTIETILLFVFSLDDKPRTEVETIFEYPVVTARLGINYAGRDRAVAARVNHRWNNKLPLYKSVNIRTIITSVQVVKPINQ